MLFWKSALLIALGACCTTAGRAHPLQAEPINHPYVFTFDQFHLPVDDDESLIPGGLLLMAETNCVSCHATSDEWTKRLAPHPGPDLQGVGSRLDADTIWLIVRSPQHRKKGTLMPGQFTGDEGDAEKVEALTQYLLTLKKPVEPMPVGDAARGKSLYHTTGCVACHEPALDYHPASVPSDREAERPGNASVPIAFADAYELNALGRYLLDPLATHPAGRMPSMRLSPQEAADIAAYLHVGRTAEVAQERAILKLPPQSPDAGRKLFTEMRCNACHTTGESLPDARPAMPMAKLKPDHGCMAEQPAAGTMRFDFNPLQRRALSIALQQVQKTKPAVLSAPEQLDWQMRRLNCYGCHDRDGKGGPEDARVQYFAPASATEDNDKLPPTLDGVGMRMKLDELRRVLHGERHPTRPSLLVRMPDFGAVNARDLPLLFQQADK